MSFAVNKKIYCCLFILGINSIDVDRSMAIDKNKIILSSPSFKQQNKAREYYQQGILHFNAHEYHLSIKKLLAALQLNPDYPEAYNTLGLCFGSLEQYNAAIIAFSKAIALDKNFSNAYYNRGYTYKQQGKRLEALADFNQALALTDNNHISALINRSLIYVWQQNYQQAQEDLDRAIAINPQEATAYYNRALIHLEMGNIEAYSQDLSQAEKLYSHAVNQQGMNQIKKVRASVGF